MPALPRISWCADKGFLYFDIERKKYYTCFTLLQGVYTEFGTASHGGYFLAECFSRFIIQNAVKPLTLVMGI
jgi:hypothetical protein